MKFSGKLPLLVASYVCSVCLLRNNSLITVIDMGAEEKNDFLVASKGMSL